MGNAIAISAWDILAIMTGVITVVYGMIIIVFFDSLEITSPSVIIFWSLFGAFFINLAVAKGINRKN